MFTFSPPGQAPEKIAVVGSRDYSDLDAVRAFVRALPPGTVIVSGGARGVDAVAAREARTCGLHVLEHLPDWDTHGKSAGPIRNAHIVRDADRIVAFWDGESRGTKNTLDRARRAGKPVEVRGPVETGPDTAMKDP